MCIHEVLSKLELGGDDMLTGAQGICYRVAEREAMGNEREMGGLRF